MYWKIVSIFIIVIFLLLIKQGKTLFSLFTACGYRFIWKFIKNKADCYKLFVEHRTNNYKTQTGLLCVPDSLYFFLHLLTASMK